MEFLSSRVIIHPRDPERSLAFYRDTLGLAVFREFPGGTVFFLGNGHLELSGRGGHEASPDVALWVQVRDIAEAAAELRERGVEFEQEPRLQPWGLHEAWLADPDGVRIVLVEVPPEHPMRLDSREPG
ncbi:VOC family protein [Actinokineospora globicatena]|uniref:VOC family protein n=1 Tax=Actinokineospora globicatena TaxID=103729 RepID=UPI0020A311A9|nr:VOC family protein [Actinokineospora globicatena]MCP2305275.1 Glyoxalase-like domain-containing protein [Actinokineospora globicatena]GLW80751.1 glyoxalase [Actinokineospora globicatena]GLW87578.1 glyoxalase [Actinokineospora globicatena]